MWGIDNKRTWTKTSSTFLRYRQTPLQHIRVKAHVYHVSVELSLLLLFKIWRIFKNKNKANAFYFNVSYESCYIGCPIKVYICKGKNKIIETKVCQ